MSIEIKNNDSVDIEIKRGAPEKLICSSIVYNISPDSSYCRVDMPGNIRNGWEITTGAQYNCGYSGKLLNKLNKYVAISQEDIKLIKAFWDNS